MRKQRIMLPEGCELVLYDYFTGEYGVSIEDEDLYTDFSLTKEDLLYLANSIKQFVGEAE